MIHESHFLIGTALIKLDTTTSRSRRYEHANIATLCRDHSYHIKIAITYIIHFIHVNKVSMLSTNKASPPPDEAPVVNPIIIETDFHSIMYGFWVIRLDFFFRRGDPSKVLLDVTEFCCANYSNFNRVTNSQAKGGNHLYGGHTEPLSLRTCLVVSLLDTIWLSTAQFSYWLG